MLKWKRVNSVTPGGKKHYYFSSTFNKKFYVVWNRMLGSWTLQVNGGLEHPGTLKQCKQLAEREVK